MLEESERCPGEVAETEAASYDTASVSVPVLTPAVRTMDLVAPIPVCTEQVTELSLAQRVPRQAEPPIRPIAVYE